MIHRRIHHILLFMSLMLIFAACKEQKLSYVAIETKPVLTVSGTIVCGLGRIKAVNDATVSRYGFCYSTSPDPTVDDEVVELHEYSEGDFSCYLGSLKEKTTYYIRAFATNEMQTVYGQSVTCTTSTCSLPTVGTSPVSDIQRTSAKLNGKMLNTGGAVVTELGFYFSSTETSPKHTNGATCSKIGEPLHDDNVLFSAIEDELGGNTKYYVRAYAKNSKGYAYGDVVSFTTLPYTSPVLSSTTLSQYKFTTAIVNGNVTDDGGKTVTSRGICYSTSPYPTIGGNRQSSGSGTGSFSVQLTGLTPGTTYYARAYATNSVGTSYGTQISFTTIPPDVFEISSGTYVKFAPGNLQYCPSSQSWRFAPHQYDYIGADNAKISQTYTGYIDLFGYGTSGYTYKPYSSTLSSSLYASSTITATKHEWGYYCYNYGYISGGSGYDWFTMTEYEWYYVIERRSSAPQKCSRATVNGTKGIILLPEIWTNPSGCSFVGNASSFSTNTYSLTQWSAMENAGAVFLPAAGFRKVTTVYTGSGSYWSSTWSPAGTSMGGDAYKAQPAFFYYDDSNLYTYGINTGQDVLQGYGRSVRLVRKVAKISSTSNAPARFVEPIRPHAVPDPR